MKLNPLFALSCALLAFLFCPAFPAQQQPPKPDESDKHLKIQTTLVTLPVIAMNSDSRFIPDLRATNFQVFEEGIPQEITFFASAEEPLTVALLLDVSDSTESQMQNIRQAAIAFAEQLRATDKVMVVAFDSRTQILTEAVGDQQKIRDAILHAKTGGGTRLYDALDFVIRERMRTHRGRKAMILFTDGVDNDSLTTSEKVLHLVAESDIFIYPIEYHPTSDTSISSSDIFSAKPSYRGDFAKADTFLRLLAGASGARFQMVDNPKNMTKSFVSIAEELRKQYVIGYYPNSVGKPGQRRKVKVKATRSGIVVRSRNYYIY